MTTFSTSQPHVYLVGAGPGDPELLTFKAAKAIAAATVLLVDDLVSDAVLAHATPTARIVHVGKRGGCQSTPQAFIQKLMVQEALAGECVVRLKGGDPFIFGRGAEELDYAKQFGIETYMVPGISSALAVPAYQGIPLTKRGSSESFWVITGTTKSHQLSNDVKLAAKSTATVVILMGMGKLQEIVKVFSDEGKQNLPVAIIQNGTTKYEKFGVGTMETICDVVKERQLSSPAIIIIGEVVKQRSKLDSITTELQTQTFCHPELVSGSL